MSSQGRPALAPTRQRAGLTRGPVPRSGGAAGRGGGAKSGWRGPFGWNKRQTAAAVVALGIVAFLLLLTVTWFSLPDPANVALHAGEVKMYDRTGTKLVADVTGSEIRTPTGLAKISPLLQEATVAAEDRNFYTHHGIDWPRLAKAITVDLISRRAEQGASTITQQLAKNDLLATPNGSVDRTITRKFKEAILATRLEGLYPKNQILELYLNSIYYGHHAYGIGAASKVYFGKEASDLTLGQASFLAGLPQAPATYDPKTNYAGAKARQAYVLDQMVRDAQMLHDTTASLNRDDKSIPVLPLITEQQADAAKAEDTLKQLVYKTDGATGPAPHFVEYVMGQLERTYGASVVASGGLSVTTSLDLDIQAAATKAVQDGIPKLDRYGVNNGAMLVTSEAAGHRGEILAMVGSADFNHDEIAGQVNIVTTPRQPGSSFKPYDYITGINDRKFNTLTVFHDTKTDFGGNYTPFDFDNRFEGPMRMRKALVESRNVPAVEAMQKAGVSSVIETAHRLGISTKLEPHLATAIGASEVTMLDHSEAYGVLATMGTKHDPVSILKVQNAGQDLTVDHNDGQQVMSSGPAFIIADILKGYSKQWNLGFPGQFAAKSGTTNIGTATGDGWMMTYNPDVVVATWAGHTSNKPSEGNATKGFFGVTGAQVITAPFLKAMGSRWKSDFKAPSDVKQVNCQSSGVDTAGTPPGGESVLTSDPDANCTPPSPSPTATPSPSPPPVEPTPTPVIPETPIFSSPTPRPSPSPSPTPQPQP